MNRILIGLIVSLLATYGYSEEDEQVITCSGTYLLEQAINMQLTLDGAVQYSSADVQYVLHVREVGVPDQFELALSVANEEVDLTAYLFLIDELSDSADSESTNDEQSRAGQKYPHPFVSIVDRGTGELLELQSSETDLTTINEYRSFYDLFQYSTVAGRYRYQNGYGHYTADIKVKEDGLIERNNLGFITSQNQSNVQVLESQLRYELSEDDCFFHSATGSELLNQTLSPDTYIDISATLNVVSAPDYDLKDAHFFNTLTAMTTQWPIIESSILLTQDELDSKIPVLITALKQISDDDDAVLSLLKESSALLPFLEDYLVMNELDDQTSKVIFWALDRMDSRESVAALVALATASLNTRDNYRSAVSLSGTTYPLTQEEIATLKNHFFDYSGSEQVPQDHLVYVRMFGVVANRRANHYPAQANEIRDFLYTQMSVNSTEMNKAVTDALGNLGEAIDEQGYDLLMQQTRSANDPLRRSSVAALSRLPYSEYRTNEFLQQYNQETSTDVRRDWLAVFEQSTSGDVAIKQALFTTLAETRLRSRAIEAIDEIGYTLSLQDIEQLKGYLRREQNPTIQGQLGSIIMKAKRLSL